MVFQGISMVFPVSHIVPTLFVAIDSYKNDRESWSVSAAAKFKSAF